MPSKSPADKILPQLADWQLADLKDLQAALAGLVEALEATQENTFMTPDATTEEEIKNRLTGNRRGDISKRNISPVATSSMAPTSICATGRVASCAPSI